MAPANISVALPIVKSALECANYQTTVEPYLDQLRPLSELVLQHIADPAALKQIYIDTNPFVSGLAISIALSPFFLFISELNQNFSQVDRVWPILPTVYHAHWAFWAHLSGLATDLLFLRLTVSVLWSTRLTYNYWRRGGYQKGSEDYRWNIIKDKIGQPAFFALDLFFIASVQNVLLFLVTSPAYVQLLVAHLNNVTSGLGVTFLDYVFASAIIGIIGLTWIADQQQWNYQTAKYAYRDSGKVPKGSEFSRDQLEVGFRTTGLWAYSRHPNFICEQSVWWTFYLWSSVNAGMLINWSIIGPILYSAIFMGSTPLTEWITSQKYPAYKQYQSQVGMFFPTSISPAQIKPNVASSNGELSNGASKNAKDYAQAKKRYDLR